jgi:hypothetical protein
MREYSYDIVGIRYSILIFYFKYSTYSLPKSTLWDTRGCQNIKTVDLVRVKKIFSINHVETEELALGGDRCMPTCPCLFKGVHLLKRGRTPNSCDAHFRIKY